MLLVVFFAVVGFIAYRSTTSEMRADAARVVLAHAKRIWSYGRKELKPFGELLRARTPRLIATPAIVLACAACTLLLSPTAGFSDGPRTTNGEWWRLGAAMFAQPTFLLLIINIAALVQLGNLLERLVGALVFSGTFVAAGLLSQLVVLWLHPLAPWRGASAAIAGIYGLLAVSFVARRLRRSELLIPLAALKRVLPVAMVVMIGNASTGFAPAAGEAVGFLIGVAASIAIATDSSIETTSQRRLSVTFGVAALVALAIAVPLRGILDVKPELERLVALEGRTKHAYDGVYAAYQARKADADAVARTIDDSILPLLRAADDRVSALRHIPPEDAPRVAGARRYLALRTESWTLLAQSLRQEARPPAVRRGVGDGDAAFRARAQAWHRSTATIRGKAEAAEREALETLSHAVEGSGST